MDSVDSKYITEQKEKMAKMYQQGNDKYNVIQEDIPDESEYRRILNAKLTIAPKAGQSWKDYLMELTIHTDTARETNWNTHYIKGSHGHPWFTHKNPLGCFMCNDIEMIHVMLSVMKLMAEQYPKNRF